MSHILRSALVTTLLFGAAGCADEAGTGRHTQDVHFAEPDARLTEGALHDRVDALQVRARGQLGNDTAVDLVHVL